MRCSRRRLLAAALALSLAVPGSATGQAPAPRKLEFATAVTVVTVPVYVTGRDGRPVTGLTAADFEVEDDGKDVEVVGFHQVDAAAPPPAMSSRGAVAARRQFLILFDLSFTSVSGLLRAREAAMRFVEKDLGAQDLASVAAFSSTAGMKLLVGFTTDRAQLRAAVESLGLGKGERKSDPLGLVYDFMLNRPQTAASEGSLGTGGMVDIGAEMQEMLRAQAMLQRQSDAEAYANKVRVLTKAMVDLGRALDSVQGRKTVIYLSAGFDDSALSGAQGTDAFADGQAVAEGRLWDVQSDSRFGSASARSDLAGMMRAFAGSDVVVHTVDVTGLAAGGSDASLEGDVAVKVGAGRESLSSIAKGTGGRFYKDANDLRAVLGDILDSTRHYYVLAFEPADTKGPGKFHKLKVKVRGAGEVSHRAGFYETSPDLARNPLVQRFQAAEAVIKGVTGGEIGLRTVAVAYRTEDGRLTVPVALHVDGPSLLARGKGDELPLEIYGYALNEQGGVEDVFAMAPRLALAKVGAKLKESGLLVQTAFAARPGRYSLRFLVRDTATGRKAVSTTEVVVPAFDGLVLAPPLFMDDPARWLAVQAPSRQTGTVDLPFHVGTDVFAPRSEVRLANGRTDSVVVMAYTGQAKYGEGAQFEIKAQLLKDGTAVRMGKLALARAVAETDGFRRFVLSVTPADVAPGDYTFKVKITDPSTGTVHEASREITID